MPVGLSFVKPEFCLLQFRDREIVEPRMNLFIQFFDPVNESRDHLLIGRSVVNRPELAGGLIELLVNKLQDLSGLVLRFEVFQLVPMSRVEKFHDKKI